MTKHSRKRQRHSVNSDPDGRENLPTLSKRKRIIFRIVVFTIPFIVLVVLELLLRAGKYDGNLSFIRKERLGGHDYYVVNRSVGKRFFTSRDAAIPEPHEDRFACHKGTHTKRVFCLGESTMEGFPYEFNPTPPYLLRDRLQSAFPGDAVEVINAGLSAVGR